MNLRITTIEVVRSAVRVHHAAICMGRLCCKVHSKPKLRTFDDIQDEHG